MRIKYVTILTAFGLLVAAAPAAAQVFCIPVDDSGAEPELDELAACLAGTTTPFGALPTTLPASWLGRTTSGIGVSILFGSMSEEGDAGRRNFGVGIDVPLGRANLAFTGGLVDFTCDVPEGFDVECKSAMMLGARFATPLVSNPIAGETGQSFIIGLNTSAGFSNGDIVSFSEGGESIEVGGRAFSVGVGVPVGLVARSGNITITPFIEPAFFWGQTTFDISGTFAGEEDESGTGFALGGGVSFALANGIVLDIGFKKVMIDEANALIGLGLSFKR
jgi:opacity protein-like surface antigen